MNSMNNIIGGVLLIILGVFGIYHIREFPGLALFATIGLLAGIFLIGKATKKFSGRRARHLTKLRRQRIRCRCQIVNLRGSNIATT